MMLFANSRHISEFFGQFCSPSPHRGSLLSARGVKRCHCIVWCRQKLLLSGPCPSFRASAKRGNPGRCRYRIPCFSWITSPKKGLGTEAAKAEGTLSHTTNSTFVLGRVLFSLDYGEGNVDGATQASTATSGYVLPAAVAEATAQQKCIQARCRCREARGWCSGTDLPWLAPLPAQGSARALQLVRQLLLGPGC